MSCDTSCVSNPVRDATRSRDSAEALKSRAVYVGAAAHDRAAKICQAKEQKEKRSVESSTKVAPIATRDISKAAEKAWHNDAAI